MLSAFFWGYATTQVIGGYLSDRCGAKLVMISAMIGWSGLTLITPIMTHACCDGSRSGVLYMFVFLRILTGCVQGDSVCVLCLSNSLMQQSSLLPNAHVVFQNMCKLHFCSISSFLPPLLILLLSLGYIPAHPSSSNLMH